MAGGQHGGAGGQHIGAGGQHGRAGGQHIGAGGQHGGAEGQHGGAGAQHGGADACHVAWPGGPPTLTEELLAQAEQQPGLARLLLAVLAVVRAVGSLLLGPAPAGGLGDACNRAWLGGLARSRQAALLVSSRAASVIEVEPELQVRRPPPLLSPGRLCGGV
jgi:hypothetical protein